MENKKENTKSGKEKAIELLIKYKEIVAYIIVGGITTLVRWGTTTIFDALLMPIGFTGLALSIFTTLFSLIVTILFAFVPNKLYVFESKSFDKSILSKEFISFISARAVASIIELAGIPLLVAIGLNYPLFGSETLLATMVVSIVVLIANYVFSKLVVFKKRVPQREESTSERKAERAEKAAAKKDKLIGILLTIVCVIIAVISIGAVCAAPFINSGADTSANTDTTQPSTSATVTTTAK